MFGVLVWDLGRHLLHSTNRVLDPWGLIHPLDNVPLGNDAVFVGHVSGASGAGVLRLHDPEPESRTTPRL